MERFAKSVAAGSVRGRCAGCRCISAGDRAHTGCRRNRRKVGRAGCRLVRKGAADGLKQARAVTGAGVNLNAVYDQCRRTGHAILHIIVLIDREGRIATAIPLALVVIGRRKIVFLVGRGGTLIHCARINAVLREALGRVRTVHKTADVIQEFVGRNLIYAILPDILIQFLFLVHHVIHELQLEVYRIAQRLHGRDDALLYLGAVRTVAHHEKLHDRLRGLGRIGLDLASILARCVLRLIRVNGARKNIFPSFVT